MIEPDEALMWAREDAAQQCEKYGPMPGVDFPAEYRAGLMDVNLDDPVRAYRAGQAASAERIKALEEAIREAMRRLNEYADMTLEEWDDTIADNGAACWMLIRQELETVVVYRLARALLKEADQ